MMTRTSDDVKRDLRSAVNHRADMRRRITATSGDIITITARISALVDELADMRRAELETYADTLVTD